MNPTSNRKKSYEPKSYRQGVKRSLSSSPDSLFERQHATPQGKKARRIQWTDDLKIALLQCRQHLNHIFDDSNECNVRRAWDKIANMLDTTCTGEDCVQMFESLVQTYLQKQQTFFTSVSAKSQEWKQYQILEKLFVSSPRLAELYDVELTPVKVEPVFHSVKESDDEESGITELCNYNASFAKYYNHIRQYRRRQEEREGRLVEIVKDIRRIRQENKAVVSEFLKRILYNFNNLDELARRESLEAITSIYPGVFSLSTPVVSIVTNYLQSSARENKLFETINVYLLSYYRLIEYLVDTPDEEDEIHLKAIPYHEQYLEKREVAAPEGLANQPSMSDFDFKGHLHVTRSTMEALIAKFGVNFRKPSACVKLGTQKDKYVNFATSHLYLSVERQALVFVWFLTHNEIYEQVALRFGVPLVEVIGILRNFIEFIIDSQLDFIKFPKGALETTEVVKEFELTRTPAFPGVIGAIGTKYLSVKTPAWFKSNLREVSKNETIKQQIAVQGISNAKHIFIDVHTAWLDLSYSEPAHLKPVTTEEMKAVVRYKPEEVFTKSPFYVMYCKRPKEEGVASTFFLKPDVHVVADASFPLSESVMVPYDKADEESPSRSLFNQQLHKTRSVVDVAFGKLLNRFSCLRHMDHILENSNGLIKACIGVHNFCLRAGDDFSARDITLPVYKVQHSGKMDINAIAKRDKICEEMNIGEISYVYRGVPQYELCVSEKAVQTVPGEAHESVPEAAPEPVLEALPRPVGEPVPTSIKDQTDITSE
ncbi:hypothetical protein GE061_006004 [Apolygus lucorum]|uniref:DDE Tnp4 domain-containing protein n=1 Tax=Apolygus lucorum TaxID=248454 RepID=A0A6A4J6M1_APOLU|nr:hypothetical protein GE061_006004 [Apolygus lucorum]